MMKRAYVSLALSSCLAVAGCMPMPMPAGAPAPTASSSGSVFTFACPVDGRVMVRIFPTQVVVTFPNGGTETYAGTGPTFYGNEASVTILNSNAQYAAGTGAIILAGLGEQQTCGNAGMG